MINNSYFILIIALLYSKTCDAQTFISDKFKINFDCEFKLTNDLNIKEGDNSYKCKSNIHEAIYRINVSYLGDISLNKEYQDTYLDRYVYNCKKNSYEYKITFFHDLKAIEYTFLKDGTEKKSLIFISNERSYTLTYIKVVGNTDNSWDAFLKSFNFL